MILKQEGAAVGPDQLRRIGVLGCLDQLDLTRAQLVELLSIEARPQQRVAQQLEHKLLIARQELAADRDRFRASARVEAAAHPFDGIGELECAALSSALFQQARDQ